MTRARLLCALTCAALAASLLVPAEVAAGGGCHTASLGESTQARSTEDAVTATIGECAFQPTVLYVDRGAEVTWRNKDLFDHTVTGANISWGSERFLAEGDAITQKFTEEGVFPYFCLLHPGMVGAVVVGDPDPDAISDTAMIGSSGVFNEPETDAAGTGEEAAAPISDRAASDSVPLPALLGTLALLALAIAVAFALARRRGRVELEA